MTQECPLSGWKGWSNNWECRCRQRRKGNSWRLAKLIRPVLEEWIRQAAQGSVMHKRRHGHADSAPGARAGRQAHRDLHQRSGIDRWRVENRAVLYGIKACGREYRRGAKTARPRTPCAHPDVRRAFAQHAEAGRGRNPAGELSRPWQAAVCRSGGELSPGMPAWPERIDSGDAGTSLENGRKTGLQQHKLE